MIKKICKECAKEFLVYDYRKKAKYCSSICYQKNWKNYIYGVKIKKGQHLSLKTEFKKGRKGDKQDKSPVWKGNKATYGSIHTWVIRNKGSPTKCEHCGKTELNTKAIDWANVDHRYKRNLNDYIRLCRFCHRKYDKQYNKSPRGLVSSTDRNKL